MGSSAPTVPSEGLEPGRTNTTTGETLHGVALAPTNVDNVVDRAEVEVADPDSQTGKSTDGSNTSTTIQTLWDESDLEIREAVKKLATKAVQLHRIAITRLEEAAACTHMPHMGAVAVISGYAPFVPRPYRNGTHVLQSRTPSLVVF